jgi:hypothetical protein
MPRFTSPPVQAQPVLVAASPSPSANGVISPNADGGSFTQAENDGQNISYYPADIPNPISVQPGRMT